MYKTLVIDKFSLIEPEIHIKRNLDGSFNFSDIAKPAPPAPTEKKTAGIPVNLNIKRISIENAKLDYVDSTGKLKKADLLMNAELGIGTLTEKALSSEGRFSITIAEAVLMAGNKSLKDIRSDYKYKIDINMESKQITVHSLDMDIMKIPVQIQGTASYAAEPAYSLDVKVPNADLSHIRQDIITAFLPEGTALSGNVAVMLNVRKAPGKNNPVGLNGGVTLSKVSLSYKGIHSVLDGSLKMSPGMVTIEGIRLIAGQNSADLSGFVKNYSTYPDANLTLRSRSLVLDDLFSSAPSSSKTPEPAKTESPGNEPEPMNLKMKATVSVDIGKIMFKGITIINFKSQYELGDNVFRILNLTGNTLSGAFAIKGAVDLAQRGTKYNMTSDLSGINLEEMVNAFAPKAKGKLIGTLSGKADVSGSGTLPANVKRSLRGKGTFAIKGGALRNSELSAGLLAILGLQELKEIPIQTADGRFTISNGIVDLTTLSASKDLGINQTGTIGMDEKLNLGVLVKVSDTLAPKLVSQSAISRFLSSEKGWTSIPLRVGGTISKPSYSIDTKALGKKATEGVQKKLGEELNKRLPGGMPGVPGKGQPSGTEPKSSPGGLLKDLFGK